MMSPYQHTVVRKALILSLAAMLWSATSVEAQPKGSKSYLLKLIDCPPPRSEFLPGWDLEGDLDVPCRFGRIGTSTFWFFDLDKNGNLEPGGMDAFAKEGIRFAVPIPERLLLPEGQFLIETAPGGLLLLPDPLLIPERVLRDAALITDLRMMAGLIPLSVTNSASIACREHCEYLHLNHGIDGHLGLGSHDQDSEKRGHTIRGAGAGRGSSIAFRQTRFHSALLAWYQSIWHRVSLVDPTIREVGVSLEHGVAMLYAARRSGSVPQLYHHPPHQATNVPRSFSRLGELPDPAPGTGRSGGAGCGFPLMVWMRGELRGRKLSSASLEDARGRIVEGYISCPESPANPAWSSNSGCAVFLPTRSLRPNTLYRVSFQFEGRDEPVEWEFTTEKR